MADPAGGAGAAKVTDYWDDAKRMLNDPGKFLASLMTYDKDNIPPVRPTLVFLSRGVLPPKCATQLIDKV